MESEFKIGEKVIITVGTSHIEGEVIGIYQSKKFKGFKYEVQFLKESVITTAMVKPADLKKCS